jgi:hypothetical protein
MRSRSFNHSTTTFSVVGVILDLRQVVYCAGSNRDRRARKGSQQRPADCYGILKCKVVIEAVCVVIWFSEIELVSVCINSLSKRTIAKHV